MSSPQLENGYTRIANELFEAVCRTDMPSSTHRVFLSIIRKTYGFNKKQDSVACSQIMALTGLGDREVRRCLSWLKSHKMIDRDPRTAMTSIVKDFSLWITTSPPPDKIVRVTKLSPCQKRDKTPDKIVSPPLTKLSPSKDKYKNIKKILIASELAEGEKKTVDKPVGESKKSKRKKSNVEQLVEYFFAVKKWPIKGPEFRRHLKAAKDVLDVCDGDLDVAMVKVEQICAWAERKELSWSLETILKRWHELEPSTARDPERKNKATIDGETAYQNKRGDWMIVPRDGGPHLKYVGSLDAIKYDP